MISKDQKYNDETYLYKLSQLIFISWELNDIDQIV